MLPADLTHASTDTVVAGSTANYRDTDSYEAWALEWSGLLANISALAKQCAFDKQQAQIEEQQAERATAAAQLEQTQTRRQRQEQAQREDEARRATSRRRRHQARDSIEAEESLGLKKEFLENLENNLERGIQEAGLPIDNNGSRSMALASGSVTSRTKLIERERALLENIPGPPLPVISRAWLCAVAALAVFGIAGAVSAIGVIVFALAFLYYLYRSQWNKVTLVVAVLVMTLLVVLRAFAGAIPLLALPALTICWVLGTQVHAFAKRKNSRNIFVGTAQQLLADVAATLNATENDLARASNTDTSSVNGGAGATRPPTHVPAQAFAPLDQSIEEQKTRALAARKERAEARANNRRQLKELQDFVPRLQEQVSQNMGLSGHPWDEVSTDLQNQSALTPGSALLGIGTFSTTDQQSFPWAIDLDSVENIIIAPEGPEDLHDIDLLLQTLVCRQLLSSGSEQMELALYDPRGPGAAAVPFRVLDKQFSYLGGTDELREYLKELTQHVAETTVKVGANGLSEYNHENPAAAIARKLLVIFDSGGTLSSFYWQQLEGILHSGPKVGVHVLIVRPPVGNSHASKEINVKWLKLHIDHKRQGFPWWDQRLEKTGAFADVEAPTPEQVQCVLSYVAAAAVRAKAVTVDIRELLPTHPQNNSSAEGISVLLNNSGPMPITLTFNTQQVHAIIGGMTGSGKSNLLHGIIMGLAMNYSPDELQMVLLDFKDAVEFYRYGGKNAAVLPHVRVISPENDCEFGRSAVDWLQNEMTERNRIFKATAPGITSIEQYRALGHKMPRMLVVFDEFQMLLAGDYAVGSQTLSALSQLVKQGRSVGIHLVFTSQTLGDISHATKLDGLLQNVSLGIALKCGSREASRRLLGGRRDDAVKLDNYEAILTTDRPAAIGGERFRSARASAEDCEDARTMISAAYGNIAHRPTVFEGHYLRPEEVLALPLEEMEEVGGGHSFIFGQPVAVEPLRALAVIGPNQKGNLAVIGQDQTAALGIIAANALALNRSTNWPIVITGIDVEAQEQLQTFLAGCGCASSIRTVEEVIAMTAVKDDADGGVDGGVDGGGFETPVSVGEPSAAVAGIAATASETVILWLGWNAPSERESKAAFANMFKRGPSTGWHYIIWWRDLNELVKETMDAFGRRVSLDGRGDSRVADWFVTRLPEQEDERAIFWVDEQQRKLALFVPYGLTISES